jgi:hypothetical protein
MKDYFQFLVFMLPTALVIGLASATVASAGAKLESPSFQLPYAQGEVNKTNG